MAAPDHDLRGVRERAIGRARPGPDRGRGRRPGGRHRRRDAEERGRRRADEPHERRPGPRLPQRPPAAPAEDRAQRHGDRDGSRSSGSRTAQRRPAARRRHPPDREHAPEREPRPGARGARLGHPPLPGGVRERGWAGARRARRRPAARATGFAADLRAGPADQPGDRRPPGEGQATGVEPAAAGRRGGVEGPRAGEPGGQLVDRVRDARPPRRRPPGGGRPATGGAARHAHRPGRDALARGRRGPGARAPAAGGTAAGAGARAGQAAAPRRDAGGALQAAAAGAPRHAAPGQAAAIRRPHRRCHATAGRRRARPQPGGQRARLQPAGSGGGLPVLAGLVHPRRQLGAGGGGRARRGVARAGDVRLLHVRRRACGQPRAGSVRPGADLPRAHPFPARKPASPARKGAKG